jgi:hypothetical protein
MVLGHTPFAGIVSIVESQNAFMFAMTIFGIYSRPKAYIPDVI